MRKNLTSKELVQFRADCLIDVDKLAEEMSNRMIDILTKYQSGEMEGIDVEIMGQIVLNEMQASIAGYFLDHVFDLSSEMDEDGSEGAEHLYEPSDDEEDEEDDEEDYDSNDVTEVE